MQYLRDLESYCEIFLAASCNEDVKKAESIIQEYKKTSTFESFCVVLNCTNNEFLIHETLSAIFLSAIANWNQFADIKSTAELELSGDTGASSSQMLDNVRWLLSWSLGARPRLSFWIWQSALATIVKLVKKAYSENVEALFHEYLAKIGQYLMEETFDSKKVGLDMINGLLTIYSGISVSNQQLKIAKDVELKNRQEFEKKYLGELFMHILNIICVIDQQSNGERSYDTTNQALMKALLGNLEMILSWNFLNKVESMKWMILPKNEAAKRFAPPTKWNSILKDLSIIDLLFKVHDKMRHSDGMVTLTCLIQLAGLKLKFRHNSTANMDHQLSPTVAANYSYSFTRAEFSLTYVSRLCDYFQSHTADNGDINGDSNGDDREWWRLSRDIYDYEVPLIAELLYQLQEHLNSCVWLDDLVLLSSAHTSVSNSANNSGSDEAFFSQMGDGVHRAGTMGCVDFPRRLAEEYAGHVLAKMRRFLWLYSAFALKCIEGAASENLSKSDTIYIETSERVLSRLVAFTNFQEYLDHAAGYSGLSSSTPTMGANNDIISSIGWEKAVFTQLNATAAHCHRRLFESFIRSHLAAPEGFRNVTTECDIVVIESDDDEDGDLDLSIAEDDKITYEGSLYACGFSGLQCLSDSVCYLSSLLHSRLTAMEAAIKGSYSQSPGFSLLEDIHWLLSVVGYTVLNVTDDVLTQSRTLFSRHADSSDLKCIYQHSRRQLEVMLTSLGHSEGDNSSTYGQVIDQYRTLLMECCQEINSGIDGNFHYSFQVNLSQCDDFIRLQYLTLRGFAFAIQTCESGQIVADFAWLFNRWMLGYFQLFPDCDEKELEHVTILAVYKEGRCRQAVIETFVRLTRACICRWAHDPLVMEALVTTLLNLTSCISISSVLLESETWSNLALSFVRVDPPFDQLSHTSSSNLMTAVMNVAIACDSYDKQNAYLGLLQPIEERLSGLLCKLQPQLQTNSISGATDTAVPEADFCVCISLVHGLVNIKWPSKFSRNSCVWRMSHSQMFDKLIPWLEQCVAVVFKKFLYSSSLMYALLDCIHETSRWMLLEVTDGQTHRFFRMCLGLFQLYSRKTLPGSGNSNGCGGNNAVSREDIITEVKLIFSIASELLGRQVFDEFEFDARVAGDSPTDDINGYDVISMLIFHLAPFITSEILNIPDVGGLFFQCATLVTEFSASSFLMKMSYEFNSSLLDLFGNSLYNSNNQIVGYCLRAMSSLADEYYSRSRNASCPNQLQMQQLRSQQRHDKQQSPPPFQLDSELQLLLERVFGWVRSRTLLSEQLDSVSSVFIVLVKNNQDKFWGGLVREWLQSVNKQFVTDQVAELLPLLELTPNGLSVAMAAVTPLSPTTTSQQQSHVFGNLPTVLPSSSSAKYRCNVARWGQLVSLINSHGDM